MFQTMDLIEWVTELQLHARMLEAKCAELRGTMARHSVNREVAIEVKPEGITMKVTSKGYRAPIVNFIAHDE